MKINIKDLSQKERLNTFLGLFQSEDRVAILINADPDSIGSAVATKRILWRKVSEACIVCVNQVQRHDNRALIRLLNIPLKPVSQISLQQFNKKILIDSQPDHHKVFMKQAFTAIIDHHPLNQDLNDIPFIDIRPEYGATSSILTEYMRAAKIKPSKRVATALFYGIKADTHNFERHSIESDLIAFRFLYKFIDTTWLRKIEHSELTISSLDYFKRALEVIKIRQNRIVIFMGEVKDQDILVMLADFFMRVENITWCIVSGVYKEKLITIFRNDGGRKDAGRMAEKMFGHIGSAGGHKSMARAEVEIDKLREELKSISASAIQRHIFKYLL